MAAPRLESFFQGTDRRPGGVGGWVGGWVEGVFVLFRIVCFVLFVFVVLFVGWVFVTGRFCFGRVVVVGWVEVVAARRPSVGDTNPST